MTFKTYFRFIYNADIEYQASATITQDLTDLIYNQVTLYSKALLEVTKAKKLTL